LIAVHPVDGESGCEWILPKARIDILITVEFEQKACAFLRPRSIQGREIPNRSSYYRRQCKQALPWQLNRFRLAHNWRLRLANVF
jgi:hypothetical protein